MPADFIVSVTESDFEYEVIAYSQNTPVIVDFWAEWCKPCKILTPMLEKLAYEAKGEFRLAKVDVDGSPNLPLRFSVRAIPTVLAFSQGNKVAEFSGVVPEVKVRDFIEHVIPPSPAHLLVQKGNSLLYREDINGANDSYLEALNLTEGYPGAILGLMKINMLKGNPSLANDLFMSFPASKEYNDAEKLVPAIKSMSEMLDKKLLTENDLDVAFASSVRLISRGNIYASIDGLMDILRQDKRYRKDKAKRVLLSLLELIDPEGEQIRLYRTELATILF